MGHWFTESTDVIMASIPQQGLAIGAVHSFSTVVPDIDRRIAELTTCLVDKEVMDRAI